MDHFNDDLSPENRWKNEVLRVMKETNLLLSELLKSLRPTAEGIKKKTTKKGVK